MGYVEFGRHRGARRLKGEITRLAPADPALKIPHMGWNSIHPTRPHDLLAGLADPSVYFVHSYALAGSDPAETLAICDMAGSRSPRWSDVTISPARSSILKRARPGVEAPRKLPDVAAMSFTLYPAIDLKDGQCVRLVKGDMLTATVFSLKPAAQAGAWQAAGFEVAPCRRSQRRVRASPSMPGNRRHPQGGDRAGATRRRHPHAASGRTLAGTRRLARHSRHDRRAQPASG